MTLLVPAVDSLPSEILAEILKIAQPRRRSRYTIPFEVVVSHVSSYWRGVALGTAQLWTSIDIYSPYSLAWVPYYLERSNTCLIDVRFDIWHIDRRTYKNFNSAIMPTVDAVLLHIHRWRSLMLFTYQQKTAKTILWRFSLVRAPALEQLRIVADGSDDFVSWILEGMVDEPPSSVFAGGTPKLLSAEIDGIWYLPPIANLTTLELHVSPNTLPFTYDRIREVADTASSLTHLSIRGNVNISDWPLHSSPAFAMESIRSLLFSNDNILAALFLTSISLPQLQSLWLDCPHIGVQERLIKTPYILRQDNFPALQYLTWQNFDFNNNTNLLTKIFPSITHLHLLHCNVFHIRNLSDALLERDGTNWAHLDTIVIQTIRDQHVKKLVTVMENIIASRLRDGRPIRRLLLDSDLFALFARFKGHVELGELNAVNYEDYWWKKAHMDTSVRI